MYHYAACSLTRFGAQSRIGDVVVLERHDVSKCQRRDLPRGRGTTHFCGLKV